MTPTTHKPTLRTIAELTGYAKTTVSRALGDAPDIPEKTKAKIRSVAERIGYRRSLAGVQLRTGRTHTVALVLRTSQDTLAYTAKLINGLSMAFGAAEHQMIVTPFGDDEDPVEPMRRLVRSGTVDGVIFNEIEPNDARVRFLSAVGMPFATHGRTIGGIEHAYTDFDNRALAREAAQLLVERGRRSLLFISPPPRYTYARELMTGLCQGLEGSGARLRVLRGATIDCGGEAIRNALSAEFGLLGPPDAMFVPAQRAAIEAVAAARAHGLVLGQSYDLVCKECMPLIGRCFPGAITALEDLDAACAHLCRALLNAIENPASPPLQLLDRRQDITVS